MIIRRVGPFSVAKMCFVLYGLIGLVSAVLVAVAIANQEFLFTQLFGATLAAPAPASATPLRPFLILGMTIKTAAFVLLPLFYAVTGFITGLIGAVLYNLVAAIIGGVEIDVQT